MYRRKDFYYIVQAAAIYNGFDGVATPLRTKYANRKETSQPGCMSTICPSNARSRMASIYDNLGSLQTLEDIQTIAGGRAAGVTEAVSIHVTRILQTQGLVDGLLIRGVADLVEVGLVVLGARRPHGGDLVLTEAVLAAELWAAFALY
jgi:hypothetical protein